MAVGVWAAIRGSAKLLVAACLTRPRLPAETRARAAWGRAFSRRGFLARAGSLTAVTATAIAGGTGLIGDRGPPATDAQGRAPLTTVPAPAPLPPGPVSTAGAATRAPAVVPRLRQPNVLLVTIDTTRADHLGAYGFAGAHTPTLDRLSREGARFGHAICQLPQTNASHASLMTGLYPSTNGVKVHMIDKLRPGSQTLASVFAASGYQTAGIYSWVSLDPQFCGLDQGFQTYEGYVLDRPLMFSHPQLEDLAHGLAATYGQAQQSLPVLRTADVALNKESDQLQESIDGRADVTNAAVFKWLDAHAGRDPFFLWVHYFDPHYPYAPPPGYDHILGLDYRGRIDGSVNTIHRIQDGTLKVGGADLARLIELYQGELAFTDAQLGRLLAYLTQHGLADDTVIVVTGDHGESFGEHGDWTHGQQVYESEIRVPLLVRYPRRLSAGTAINAPVQLIDVMPTLLELTGLRAARPVQGTSLFPLLTGKADGTDQIAFTELADESFVSMLTTQEWKLIRNDANDELQLYHLSDDEAEKVDLSHAAPSVARELHARLDDLMKISGVSR